MKENEWSEKKESPQSCTWTELIQISKRFENLKKQKAAQKAAYR